MKNIKKIEDSIINNKRNIFRLTQEIDNTAIKDVKNLFRLKKENEATKYRVIRDIRNFFNMKKIANLQQLFQSKNYLEYGSNCDKNKTLPTEEYLLKISPYLKGIINDLKTLDT